MTRGKVLWGAFATALAVVVFLATGRPVPVGELDPIEPRSAASVEAPPDTASTAETHQGFLYGRVHTDGGDTWEGRLRFGGGEEAFWGDSFNGYKSENPWAREVPPERLKERRPFEVFGIEVMQREHQIELTRPLMVRFGDIVRIEVEGRDLRVALKSGTVFHLDRYDADDLADGLRVWDRRGVVDLTERRIRLVELLPTARLEAAPVRLHGTVRTARGDFTGFVQWDRAACVGSDELVGSTADEEMDLRFDAIRSIARESRKSARVTLLDGRELVLSGTRQVGDEFRGVLVEDRRYGRVLIAWEAFQRVDFDPDGSGPAYEDFPPGRPLEGSVTTRDGRRLAGRLVYDLDESETTETLDAEAGGVNYSLPFGLVASIEIPSDGGGLARVTLHDGEQLELERGGDLDDRNGGLLVFVEGAEPPTHVPWIDVARIDLDRPAAMYPPLGEPAASPQPPSLL